MFSPFLFGFGLSGIIKPIFDPFEHVMDSLFDKKGVFLGFVEELLDEFHTVPEM